jgi:hypothetical protein
MEAEQVAVDPNENSAWLKRPNSIVDPVPGEFLFNMDETGCLDHFNSREVRVIVSIDYGEPSVPVPFDRHSKRSTLVAYTAADGFRMKPFGIADRVTAEKKLQYYGYDALNATLISQANAFMMTTLLNCGQRPFSSLPSNSTLQILYRTAELCFSWMSLDPIILTDSWWNVKLVKLTFCF